MVVRTNGSQTDHGWAKVANDPNAVESDSDEGALLVPRLIGALVPLLEDVPTARHRIGLDSDWT